MIVFSTTLGDFTVKLYPKKAPKTVENFLKYVNENFFDDTIFHRVIPRFVIQGGGFTIKMIQKKTHSQIVNEADNGLKNIRGTLSMARTEEKDSATSQFFINLSDNTFLDHGKEGFGYAVFATVVEGLNVVDQIAAVPTRNNSGHQDVPTEPVIVHSARIKK